MMNKSVVIIGAGLSGLNAARRLLAENYRNVTILEAQPQPGGRVRTAVHDTDAGLVQLDMGASWLHGIHGNALYDYVTEKNIPTVIDTDVQRGNTEMRKQDSRHQVIEAKRHLEIHRMENGHDFPVNIVKDVERMMEEDTEFAEKIHGTQTDHNRNVDVGMKTYFKDKMLKRLGEQELEHGQLNLYMCALNTKLLFECTCNACDDMDQVSLHQYGTYKQLEGVHPRLKNTFLQIVQSLVQDVGAERVLCNKPVCKVTYKDQQPSPGFVVQCVDGSQYAAGSVICTASLAVLQQCHGHMFAPSLPPQYAQAIENLSMDVVDKIYLIYDHLSFMPQDVESVWFHWGSGISEKKLRGESCGAPAAAPTGACSGVVLKDWCKSIGWVSTAMGHEDNMLLAWICGDAAREMEQETEDTVGEQCREILRRFLGTQHVPLPNRVVRSRWHSNEYTRGSYTYIPTHSDVLHMHQLATPLHMAPHSSNYLIFGGEATHASHYSTAHGAFESGDRAAQQIINRY